MKYKKIALRGHLGEIQIYSRIEDDGKTYITCTSDNPDFKEWVAEGNTPEAAH